MPQHVHHFPTLGLTRARRALSARGGMRHRLDAALNNTAGGVAGFHCSAAFAFRYVLSYGVFVTKLLKAC